MAGTIPLPPGSDPILTRETEIIGALIDAKIAAASSVTLARVYIGCDGLQHVQLPNAVSCCPTCETAPGSLVPVYTGNGTGPLTGSTPYIHSGSAGQPTIVGGSRYTPPPTVLPARYLDSVGNLWDENGLWLSAGNTPAVISNQYGVDGYPWPESSIRAWPTPGSADVAYGDIYRRGTLVFVNTQIAGQPTMISASTPYGLTAPLFDGACDGVATTGPFSSGDYLCSVEFFVDITLPYTGLITGPYVAIRLRSSLLLQTSQAITGITGASTFLWSVGAAPDGTWIVHRVIQGNSTCTLHRYGFSGSIAIVLPTLAITNDGYSGKTAWTSNTFIKQVQ